MSQIHYNNTCPEECTFSLVVMKCTSTFSKMCIFVFEYSRHDFHNRVRLSVLLDYFSRAWSSISNDALIAQGKSSTTYASSVEPFILGNSTLKDLFSVCDITEQ